MKRPIVILTLAVAAFAAPVAQADHLSAAGLTCGFISFTDPTAEPGTQQPGFVYGGPVALAALPSVDDSVIPPTVTAPDPGDHPVSATIECSVQVNSPFHGATDDTEDANDANDAADASATGTAVVVLPPTQIPFAARPGDLVYLCTEWTLVSADGDTEKLYLDDDGDDTTTADSGEFETDPSGAHCAIATTIETGGGEPTPEEQLIDSIVCPLLAIVFWPEGDIPGIWDCPPYSR